MLLAAAWWAAPPVPAAEPERAARPNILWLVAEDSTTSFGCYGDELARTPGIDGLAARGVVFDRCFLQPVCAPSRFALVTGLFAAACGPAEHMRAQGRIPAGLVGFPCLLREAGYYTTNAAKTDYNAPLDVARMWHASGANAHYRDRPNPRQPFFAVFNHEVCHESCLFAERDGPLAFSPTDPGSVRLPPYLPDTPEMRADLARHYDRQALLDRKVAARLAELEQDGVADDTIVFFFADNGGVIPRSKRFLHASGTRVPLVVSFPDKWRHLAPAAPGDRLADPVCGVDFSSTVLALAGVPLPDRGHGRPFAGRPTVAPPAARPREYVFCSRDRMDARYDTSRSVIDRRWLYIHNFRPDIPYAVPLEYMFRARGGQSWARQAREGRLTAATAQFWGPKPVEELYDLGADPHNVVNLAADPAHGRTLIRMREALKEQTLRIVDNGFLPEGSPLEGYESSRRVGAYPLERVYDVAVLAATADRARLSELLAALDDPSEPVRWWAAQGCTVLGRGGHADLPRGEIAAALARRCADPSGGVRAAVAEALDAMGDTQAALAMLEGELAGAGIDRQALQAANVLDRLGERARPALAGMKRMVVGGRARTQGGRGADRYPLEILAHAVAVLEGREPGLVYPDAPPPVSAGPAAAEASGH
jgi:arylsulfatase A-like enzyme